MHMYYDRKFLRVVLLIVQQHSQCQCSRVRHTHCTCTSRYCTIRSTYAVHAHLIDTCTAVVPCTSNTRFSTCTVHIRCTQVHDCVGSDTCRLASIVLLILYRSQRLCCQSVGSKPIYQQKAEILSFLVVYSLLCMDRQLVSCRPAKVSVPTVG